MNSIFKCTLATFLLLFILGCNQTTKIADSTEEKRKKIEMVTDFGTMIFELYNETPLHRDNFINLAKHKAYDSILFHRVIKDFMIQAGDPDSKSAKVNDTLGEGDVPYKVDAEFNSNLFHKKGTLAAARDNNPEKASSGMQFYIVQGRIFNDSTLAKSEERKDQDNAVDYFKNDINKKWVLDSIQAARHNKNLERYSYFRDSILSLAKMGKDFKGYIIPENQRTVYKTIGGTPHLDQLYTVFGEVIQGIEVLDTISKAETGDLDRPSQDIRILRIRIME